MPGRRRSSPSRRPSRTSDFWQFWAVLLVLIGLLTAVYGRSLRSPFIFDDVLSVVGNASIRQLWPLWQPTPGTAPLSPPINNPTAGRPLVNLTFALNWHFGGADPWGYHVFNLAVHALSAALLWSIVRSTLRLEFFGDQFKGVAGTLAFLAALVWALHPLQTETLQYVTQRTELLVGFFYLLTFFASLGYFQARAVKQRGAWLSLATAACLAGMACKEVMVTAPVLVLLYERTFLAGGFREALRRSWSLYVGLFASWLLLIVLNHGGPRADSAGFHFDVPSYVWWSTQAKVLLMYLKLVFVPWPLAIHYATPYLDTFASAWPWVLPAGLILAGVLILVWRNTAAGFAGAWALLILSPTLVVPIVTEVAAERRMYLPLAAIVVLILAGTYALCSKRQWRPVIIAGQPRSRSLLVVAVGSLAVAMLLGWASTRRLEAYQTALGLWADTVAKQPESAFAHANLGAELSNVGRPQEAIAHYEMALRLPHFGEANLLYNLGSALARAGRPADGIEHLEASLKLKPDNPQAHGNLAQALLLTGETERAIEHFEAAMRLDSNWSSGLVEYGKALLALQRPEDAIRPLTRLVQLRPDSLDGHRFLGITYGSLGRPQEALAELEAARRLAPPVGAVPAELHRLMGTVFLGAGDLSQAIVHFEQAVRLNPQDPALQETLRNALEMQRGIPRK